MLIDRDYLLTTVMGPDLNAQTRKSLATEYRRYTAYITDLLTWYHACTKNNEVGLQ